MKLSSLRRCQFCKLFYTPKKNDGRGYTCLAAPCQEKLKAKKAIWRQKYLARIEKDPARHPYKQKKSKNPCVDCGEDKGVNRYRCNGCLSKISNDLGYPEYVGEIYY